jgi:hypothetical protein
MLRRTETVGPWIVARMSKSATCGPVVDYLLKASQYDAVDSDMALTEAFAAVSYFSQKARHAFKATTRQHDYSGS